jgi:hypothetical protein
MNKLFQKRVVRTMLSMFDFFTLVDCFDVCKKQTTFRVNVVELNPPSPKNNIIPLVWKINPSR